jgi:tryptophanyl-tRNA synthetase
MEKSVIVSGVQASGDIHIGNYLGAVQNWVRLQNSHACYIFVADLHALTVPGAVSPDDLRRSRLNAAITYLGCGIDPERAVIFCQADVPEHAYAGWLMACATPIGWLERMTQFKSKSRSNARESAGAGLLTYPALQAADIVLYRANFVPTGEDQKQHIEYTRDLVERFNQLYESALTVPNPLIERTGARIMGLDDPEAKMSKSTAKIKPAHAILLTDVDAVIRQKLRRAVTDSGTAVDETAGAGIRNLLEIYAATSGIMRENAFEKFKGSSYGALKDAVADAVIERVAPVRDAIRRWSEHPDEVAAVLAEGARKASRVAARTLGEMRRAVGVL